jgi:hypothetical protein
MAASVDNTRDVIMKARRNQLHRIQSSGTNASVDFREYHWPKAPRSAWGCSQTPKEPVKDLRACTTGKKVPSSTSQKKKSSSKEYTKLRKLELHDHKDKSKAFSNEELERQNKFLQTERIRKKRQTAYRNRPR